MLLISRNLSEEAQSDENPQVSRILRQYKGKSVALVGDWVQVAEIVKVSNPNTGLDRP